MNDETLLALFAGCITADNQLDIGACLVAADRLEELDYLGAARLLRTVDPTRPVPYWVHSSQHTMLLVNPPKYKHTIDVEYWEIQWDSEDMLNQYGYYPQRELVGVTVQSQNDRIVSTKLRVITTANNFVDLWNKPLPRTDNFKMILRPRMILTDKGTNLQWPDPPTVEPVYKPTKPKPVYSNGVIVDYVYH